MGLVNMPWASPESPSIQCGLLKAALVRDGHHVRVHYLNLQFLADLQHQPGIAAVLRLGQQPRVGRHFLLEWLFGNAAFGKVGGDTYLHDNPDLASALVSGGADLDVITELRDVVLPRWVDRVASATAWDGYDVVGFTSTFNQTVAALALARRLKASNPDVTIVFGGANFDGEMGPEYVRAFPYIDHVVVGEGDLAFPKLVGRVAEGTPVGGIAGVVSQGSQRQRSEAGSSAERVQNLDTLPTPDYDDYFMALRQLGRERLLAGKCVSVLFQTSRGCWWGQKHHCGFCGLNADGLTYRAKTAGRAVTEILELVDRYQVTALDAVDNIMDYASRQRMCELLVEADRGLRIFYEVKANMTRSQLSQLARAGILDVQPGIESLSTKMLSDMNKGSTRLLNLRFLKWASFYGVDPQWHILTGLPGETEDDYTSQAQLIPHLVHLPPPSACVPLWMDRFSPYYKGAVAGISGIRPRWAYRYVYPIEGIDLNKIAYYFDFRLDSPAPKQAIAILEKAVDAWKERWGQTPAPTLTYRWLDDHVVVEDARELPTRHVVLPAVHSLLLDLCGDSPRSLGGIREHAWSAGSRLDSGQVSEILADLADQGFVVGENGHFFGIAMPVDEPSV